MSVVDVVFLLDVDNTLLDNDGFIADFKARLIAAFGEQSSREYWAEMERLRGELGYVDYLGALQRYRRHVGDDPRLADISTFLLEYPFAERVYDGAFDALAHLRQWGPTVILSDGDIVFQPRKIRRAGLWNAVEDRVSIFIHKEQVLDTVMQRYPARHYVMVDDKLRILAAMKSRMGERLTTIFVRQGHYALDTETIKQFTPADRVLERIGDLKDIEAVSWQPAN